MYNAQKLFNILEKKDKKIVLAESCTAGLASASLGLIPGVSKYLCGSFVVYRPLQKQNILNVPSCMISEFTPESKEVVDWLAKEALTLTPEAHCSGAIVGHLGPDSPNEKDGHVWISVYNKRSDSSQTIRPLSTFDLDYSHVSNKLNSDNRKGRMIEAVNLMFETIKDLIGV